MRRIASLLLICGLLYFTSGTGGLAHASPAPQPAITAQTPAPEAADLNRRVVSAPLPSAGVGGLALLSLMMLRRWFRQKL